MLCFVRVGGLLPIVSAIQKGLVEAGGFRNLGQMKSEEGLDDVGNGYGYNYGVADGTGFSGMFLSLAPMGNYRLQIKIAAGADMFVFRTKGNGNWFSWKKVTFTALD